MSPRSLPHGDDLPDLTAGGLLLRRPKPEDAAPRFDLGRDPEIIRMYGADPETLGPWTPAMAEKWVEAIRREPFGRVIVNEGRLIGAARFFDVNLHDERAKFAIGIDDQQSLGQGVGRRVIRMMLTEAFGPMGLHRIGLRVIAFNARAIRCYLACGFQHEGVERDAARVGETRYDDICMGILAHKFRGLSHA